MFRFLKLARDLFPNFLYRGNWAFGPCGLFSICKLVLKTYLLIADVDLVRTSLTNFDVTGNNLVVI